MGYFEKKIRFFSEGTFSVAGFWCFNFFMFLNSCTSSIEAEKIKVPASKNAVEVQEVSATDDGVSLAWTEVPKASSYKITIANDADCADPIVTLSSATNAAMIEIKIYSGVFLCIEAFNSSGNPIKGATVKGYEISLKKSVEPPNALPTLSISEPAGGDDIIVKDGSYSISYSADDSDDTALIALYASTASTGCTEGAITGWTLLASDLAEAGVGSFSWATSGVAPGQYYVCAKISDGKNAPVYAISPGKLKIDAPPTLSVSTPASIVTVPKIGNFTISYLADDTDDDAVVSLYRSTGSTGCSAGLVGWTLIAENLSENSTTTYSWATNAVPSGTYYICGVITDGFNPSVYNLASGTLKIDSPPVLSFTSPSAAVSSIFGSSTTVVWNASDAEGPASIALYYKTTNSGACTSGGTLLTSGLVAGTDTFYNWNSSALTGSGEYYVCARVVDGVNPPVDIYSQKITFYNNCTWTGSTSSTWSTASNWINCGSVAPKMVDRVMIGSAPSNQPIVTANAAVCEIGLGTGGDGTITVNAGVTLTLYCASIIDSVTLKGASSTCSNCAVTGSTVSNGAVLTLESGINVSGTITVGTATSSASLVATKGSYPQNEWPKLLSIVATGPSSANRSRLTLDGVVVTNSYAYGRSWIAITGNTEIVQFDNLNFGDAVWNWVNNNDVIKFTNCSSNLITDTTWSNLNWSNSMSMRSGANSLNYPANCNTPISIQNSSGRTYGPWYTTDPGALISWPAITHQNCVWKLSPIDSAWSNAGNWDNCSARSGVPDGNDYAEIPAGAATNPVLSSSTVLARFSGGSGGGTLTVNAGQNLYMTDMSNTFENHVSIQGATSTCTTCAVQSWTSMTIRNNATLTLLSGIGLKLNDYWNSVSFGAGGTAGHLTTIGGATTAEYPWFGFRGFYMSGSATTRSRLNVDGLRHSGSSNNTVVNLTNYYEVVKFDRFSTPHAHNYLGMSVMNIANCPNALFSDTNWTDHLYSGTPGINSRNIVVGSSCATGMPVIDIYGSGSNFGSATESDPYNKINWH